MSELPHLPHGAASPSDEGEDDLHSARTVVGFDGAPDEAARAVRALELVAGVIDKLVAMGRAEEAERLLSSHVQRIEQTVQAGATVPATLTEMAARYAVVLAEATREPGWINYALRVYSALGRPLPVDVVDKLYTVLRKVHGVDAALFRRYVERLESKASKFGPAESFALKRILGLPPLPGG